MAKKVPPPLSDAQRELMEIIWEYGEVSVSEVREAISSKRQLARNTVQTMLVRLEDKGWLTHRQRGRTYYYSAARARRTNLGAKVTQMVDRFFSGSADEMVTALLEHRGLTPDEAQRIRAMIDESEIKTQNKHRKG